MRGLVDGFLLVGIALLAGALIPGSPAVVITAAVCVLWLAKPPARTGARILCVLALGVGAMRATHAIARHEAERVRADEALPRIARCWGLARVAGSPTQSGGVPRWDADLQGLECDGVSGASDASARAWSARAWSGRAALYGGPADLARGDTVEVVAQLAPPHRFFNPGTGDPAPSDARRGVLRSGTAIGARIVRRGWGPLAWIDRLRARVRARIDASFMAGAAPMARALVLGESDLAPEDDAAFRASGLSHLLAVSGMHLVLVVASIVAALRALLVRIERVAARVDATRIATACGIPLTWAYAAFAGAGGSTLRAAWMMTAGLLAYAIGRRGEGPRAFAISLFAMAAFDPLAVFDVSFLLSGAATGGILFLSAPLAKAFCDRLPAWCAPLGRSASVTLAATVPCTPILALFAPTVPLGGLLANVIAIPIGESAALPLCLLHAVLSPWAAAERGCALAASGALLIVRFIARAFAGFSPLSMPVPPPTAAQLAVLCIATAAIGRFPGRWRRVSVVAMVLLITLEGLARYRGTPHGQLRVTFLDVGQGDSALVDLPDGSALVIDAGGLVGSPFDTGARVLAPTLRERRRAEVAVAILSHPHPDHFGGLVTGLGKMRVGALWDTGQGEREGMGAGYAALLSWARGRDIPVLRPASFCGEHAIGGAQIQVLSPCPDALADRGPNDNSIVLRIVYGTRAVLFLGDAEHEEEADLVAVDPSRLRADVIKIGHHGSRTSTGRALLAAVKPQEAVISVGTRNRFGHPHPTTLTTLADAGTRVWRTDRDGAVTVVTDGTSLEVFASRPQRTLDIGGLSAANRPP